MPERLNLQTHANPEAITELRRRVAAFATAMGAGEAARDAIRLAVSSALTNVVVHAYPDGQSGDVTVEAWRDGDGQLVVVVADDGYGPAPHSDGRGMASAWA